MPQRTPLLLELFVSSVPLGKTHAGGPPIRGATTTADFRSVGAQTGALWGGRTWENLLQKKLKKKSKKSKIKKNKRESKEKSTEIGIASPRMPVGGVIAGEKIVRRMREKLGLS